MNKYDQMLVLESLLVILLVILLVGLGGWLTLLSLNALGFITAAVNYKTVFAASWIFVLFAGMLKKRS